MPQVGQDKGNCGLTVIFYIGTLPDTLPRSDITSSLNDIELVELLSSLSELESHVLYYCFILDLTQQEISNRLNISQQQVSRIKRNALNSLRKKVVREWSIKN